MAQIDAPEKKQAYGEKSRQALRDMIAGKQVRVVSDEKDKYDRTIADIYDGDQWINLAMIRDGWAWHYKRFSDDTALAQAETVAQSLKRGLWADNGVPMAPWEWRNPPNLPGYFAQGKGKKFHTGKCSTLDSRRRQVEGNEIEALGLEPCKVCKPH
ncbi:UNVERIFIED_CONTAM: hypothetical protein GTU68_036231 [Idotea baltica]|nr:hypothetical protein [Idotea baltica]